MWSVKKLGNFGWAALGIAVFVISLADIPAKLAIWQGWFTSHTMVFRWILGVIGILIALAPWIADWRKPRMELRLTPSEGPGTEQILIVRNLGKKDTFSAFCEIIGHPNGANDIGAGSLDVGGVMVQYLGRLFRLERPKAS
jgi:hypothetical protein